jgi:hypothetical protein
MIETTCTIALRAIKTVRVRCQKCFAAALLPLGSDESRDDGCFKGECKCPVCQKPFPPLSNVPFQPKDIGNPMWHLRQSLELLGKLNGEIDIDLVLPAECIALAGTKTAALPVQPSSSAKP